MKLKDILNENNMQWLHETTKIVDNVNKIANEIHDTIRHNFNTKKYAYLEYLPDTDKGFIHMPHYKMKFYQDVSSLKARGSKTLLVYCTIYCTNTLDEERTLIDMGYLHCLYQHVIDGECYLDVRFVMRDNKYNKTSLLKDMAHELTHHFQSSNNSKIRNLNYKDYNKQYNEITQQALQQNGILKEFSYVNNILTKSEISANINGLYAELKNKNVTKENYKQIYQQTEFYEYWQHVITLINKFRTLNNNQWNEFRQLSQKYEFYKSPTKIAHTHDPITFKNLWYTIVDRMIKYCNNSINQCIFRAIEDILK